jgi:hypothetical protein
MLLSDNMILANYFGFHVPSRHPSRQAEKHKIIKIIDEHFEGCKAI